MHKPKKGKLIILAQMRMVEKKIVKIDEQTKESLKAAEQAGNKLGDIIQDLVFVSADAPHPDLYKDLIIIAKDFNSLGKKIHQANSVYACD